jgi:hypothetical protein
MKPTDTELLNRFNISDPATRILIIDETNKFMDGQEKYDYEENYLYRTQVIGHIIQKYLHRPRLDINI